MSEKKQPVAHIMIKRKDESEWKPLIGLFLNAFKPTEANPNGTIKMSAIRQEKYTDKEGNVKEAGKLVIGPGDQISIKMEKFFEALGVTCHVDDEGSIFLAQKE